MIHPAFDMGATVPVVGPKETVALRPAEIEWATALGRAVRVLVASERIAMRLGTIHAHVMPPIRLNQIVFAYNARNGPTGYLTWAFLTDEVLEDLVGDPGRPLDLAEWNEGTRLVIMDVVAPSGGARQLLGAMRERVPGHDRLWWLRHDRRGARGGLMEARLRRADAGD